MCPETYVRMPPFARQAPRAPNRRSVRPNQGTSGQRRVTGELNHLRTVLRCRRRAPASTVRPISLCARPLSLFVAVDPNTID